MFKAYVASLRLAVALVCVGVGLIVGGIWLGLIPNASSFDRQQRHHRCQGIALTSASLIRDGQWEGLSRVLQLLVDQDADLTAIVLHTDSFQIRITDSVFVRTKIGDQPHTDSPAWNQRDPSQSFTLELDGVEYGKADFYHRPSLSSRWLSFAQHPLWRLVAFFALAGIAVYTVFVIRMMNSFEVTQVVPDRVRQALDTLSEGLLVMDENERIVLANKSFSSTVEMSQENLLGKRAGSLPWVCSRSATVQDYPWIRAIRQSQPQTEQLMRYQMPDGTFRFFSINSSPIESTESKLQGALATFRDVTVFEEHRAELEHSLAMLRYSRDEISTKNRELEILATQDALTGCLNRRALFEGLETLWRESKAEDTTLACLMVDNDHFKSVNDNYGHHVGDEVLRNVAAVLSDAFPAPAMVCRYGGEEFCVILPETTIEEAVCASEQARSSIEAIRLEDAADLQVTVSIGIADTSFNACEPQELINQADKCLYVAKGNGRNQVVQYCASVADVSIAQTSGGASEAAPAVATGLPFQAVTALVSALAFRDTETAEHSRRVADLCVRLAPGVLDQRSTYILEIAALLHDIGKIGVPDNILLKPGPLTDDEWKLMRRHDRIGVEIATSTFNCDELSEIIRSHRAYFGGRSRDAHLPVGNDIPIAARLLTIADSYDAMVSDRVYRKGRTHEAAIDELRRCAGVQFDPVLVDHFAATITRRQLVSGHTEEDSIPKQTAMQIGHQIERLADALDSRDVDGLQTLASRLGAMARHHRIESIALAAEKIEAGAAEENMQWINLLRDTQLLLNLCRATQNEFLSSDHSN